MKYCCKKLEETIKNNYLCWGFHTLHFQQYNQKQDIWELEKITYCPFCGEKLKT